MFVVLQSFDGHVKFLVISAYKTSHTLDEPMCLLVLGAMYGVSGLRV